VFDCRKRQIVTPTISPSTLESGGLDFGVSFLVVARRYPVVLRWEEEVEVVFAVALFLRNSLSHNLLASSSCAKAVTLAAHNVMRQTVKNSMIDLPNIFSLFGYQFSIFLTPLDFVGGRYRMSKEERETREIKRNTRSFRDFSRVSFYFACFALSLGSAK
jgi:hypothetical protein